MPSHPDRVRRNYPPEAKKSVNYHACDRYANHVFDINDICIMCGKTRIEIESKK